MNVAGQNIAPDAPMPGTEHSEHKKIGPIVAILVIVLVLVLAAIYIFANRLNEQHMPTDTSSLAANPGNDVTTIDSTVSASASPSPSSTVMPTVAPVTNTKDDVQSLQTDLNASTNGLDAQNF